MPKTYEFRAFISAPGNTEAEAREVADAALAYLVEVYRTSSGKRITSASLDDSRGERNAF